MSRVKSLILFQKKVKHLTESIEHYVFIAADNAILHMLKVEILHQFFNFPMNITATDFFQLDKQLLGNAS